MKKSYIKYIIALLLFGSNGITASNIHLTSYYIVLLRTFIGSILLFLIFLLSHKKFSFYKTPGDLLYIGISGVAMGTGWIFLYEAYSLIGVSISSLLYYCGPVIVMIISPVIFKEKLTLTKIIGFSAVICGIFLVNGASAANLNSRGIIYGILSAIMYALMVTANKKAKEITGMENSLIQLFVSFITVAVFVGIKNGGYNISVNTTDIICIIILGVLNTGVGCYLYFSSICDLPVQTVAIWGYTEPLSAVIFSVIFLKEALLPIQIAGAVLIIGGAIFGECFKRKTSA